MTSSGAPSVPMATSPTSAAAMPYAERVSATPMPNASAMPSPLTGPFPSESGTMTNASGSVQGSMIMVSPAANEKRYHPKPTGVADPMKNQRRQSTINAKSPKAIAMNMVFTAVLASAIDQPRSEMSQRATAPPSTPISRNVTASTPTRSRMRAISSAFKNATQRRIRRGRNGTRSNTAG